MSNNHAYREKRAFAITNALSVDMLMLYERGRPELDRPVGAHKGRGRRPFWSRMPARQIETKSMEIRLS